MELLFFKHDHSADAAVSADQAAKLPQKFDLVDYRPDGWQWGNEELTNPWFRIIVWSVLTDAECQTIVSREVAQVDANGVPTTIRQYRGFNLNLADARIPAALKTWWQDDTRTQPKFVVPQAFALRVADLRLAKAAYQRSAAAIAADDAAAVARKPG